MIAGQAGAEVTLKIGGTGNALGSMKLLAAAFQELNPDIKVVVLPSLGSGGGIMAVLRGSLDIGLSSRPMKDSERSPELQVIEYSRTPLVPVANRDVNSSGVDYADLIKIFRGEIKTWPEGIRIRLVVRPARESDTLALKDISPDMRSAVDAALVRPGMLVTMTDQDNADMIETLSGAFGFATLSQIIAENRTVKILSYNGVLPSVQSLLDRSYPLYKQLFLVIKLGPAAPVRHFLEFVRSDRGRKILEESGNLFVMDSPVR